MYRPTSTKKGGTISWLKSTQKMRSWWPESHFYDWREQKPETPRLVASFGGCSSWLERRVSVFIVVGGGRGVSVFVKGGGAGGVTEWQNCISWTQRGAKVIAPSYFPLGGFCRHIKVSVWTSGGVCASQRTDERDRPQVSSPTSYTLLKYSRLFPHHVTLLMYFVWILCDRSIEVEEKNGSCFTFDFTYKD